MFRNFIPIILLSISMGFAHISLANQTEPTTKIQVQISVFWDGSDLTSYNLNAVKNLKDSFPQISFIHFISPIYFLDDSKTQQINSELKKIVRSNDHIGIYLGGWQELTKKADVFFRISPSFWGNPATFCTDKCGLEVPLSVYDRDDLDKIIELSHKLVLKNSVRQSIESFAVVGWANSGPINQIAKHYGLYYNFSAIDPSILRTQLGDYPIYQWISNTWQRFHDVYTPHTFQSGGVSLVFVPQTLGMSDYHEPKEVAKQFAKLMQSAQDKSNIALLGLNFRTAGMYQLRVQKSVENILNQEKKNKLTLTFDWDSYKDSLTGEK